MTDTRATIPAVAPLDELRAASERNLEAEGIPMILGLADARRPAAGADPAQSEQGRCYARLVDHYRERIAGWARDDDEGAVITVLQLIGFTAFAEPVRPTEPVES